MTWTIISFFHTENNANARSFLEGAGISREKIEKICEAVNSVSFSKNRGKHPETLEGESSRMRIVWMLPAQLESPGRFHSEENMEGRWKIPSGISMRNFCF